MKKVILRLLPWVITLVALYVAFKGISWGDFFSNLGKANVYWIACSVVVTSSSYLLRAYRWEYFFPSTALSYADAAKVLILGFFMNNVLPARTGELVRAHVGAKVSGEKRTLVLATIASERLIDGLVISLMFVGFSLGLGDPTTAKELLYVAVAFGFVTAAVLATVALRKQLFPLLDKIGGKLNHKAGDYAVSRLQIFIEGLSPLGNLSRIPAITVLSFAIWFVELSTYIIITKAFGVDLSLAYCVLFMVAVNFSSLIPSAPGAVGVIESITKAVLVSIGINPELALAMVVTQHVIQYLVVGIPGVIVMISFKNRLGRLRPVSDDNSA